MVDRSLGEPRPIVGRFAVYDALSSTSFQQELTMHQGIRQFTIAAIAAAGLAVLPAVVTGTSQKKPTAHHMTGCLQKGDDANTYKLTNVEGTGPKTVEIVGMASGVDLAAHVGHKVTITGTTVKAEAAAAAEHTTDVKKEATEHHMKVNSVKMLSATCP